MTTPQPGIFALGTRCHHHLEFDLPEASAASVAEALGGICEPEVTGGAANIVLGFGADLWSRLGGPSPAGAGSFVALRGIDGHVAPSTQHDLWVWIHGGGADAVLDTALSVSGVLGGVGSLATECPCFVYHDSRDLTGFVDGSANPAPSEAPGVACIPSGVPGEGGSHVLVQRWVHDLAAFAGLDVADQEHVIGRTKLDSVELEDRADNSHISLAEIHDSEGNERPIYRRSTPFGAVSEKGLLFLAFSSERDRFDEMLARMFGTEGRKTRDRLLDFTRPVTGAFYFAPSLEDLARVGFGPTP